MLTYYVLYILITTYYVLLRKTHQIPAKTQPEVHNSTGRQEGDARRRARRKPGTVQARRKKRRCSKEEGGGEKEQKERRRRKRHKPFNKPPTVARVSGRGGRNRGAYHRHPPRGGGERAAMWTLKTLTAVVCPRPATETDPLKPPYEGSGEA